MMKANSLYFARMPPRAAFLLLFALALLLPITQSVPTPCAAPSLYQYNNQCYKECPWNNTLVTYLSPTNNSCIPNCPNGTFADDSSKTCTTTCPAGPIRTYYDTQHNRCVDNCSSDPMQFAAPNYTCVSNCPSPTYGDELTGVCLIDCPYGTFYMVYNLIRLCVDVCYPNYYANLSKVCVVATSCPSYPATYFGDDSTGLCVKKCPASKGTFADNSTRKCVIYCPLGTFADPVTQTCVNRCPAIPNLFGSNVTRNCLQLCNWGEYADPISRQCTRICPSDSYGDSSTRSCVKTCPTSQGTFADPLTNLCVRICPVDYYADTNTRYCVHGIDCSNNTYGDPVTQFCVQAKLCSLALFVDANQGLCVLRCSTWGNPETGFCQAECPIEYFKDPSTNLCVEACPINPSTFGDPLSRTCVGLCPVGYLADPSTLLCVETCPQNFFANDAVRQCVANCTQNSTNILFFHKPTLSCIAKCPTGYFADNVTLTCTTVCSADTFGYPPTSVCLQACPDGWFADNYTSQCVQSCPPQTGQYADPSTHYCVDTCPSNPDYYGQDLNDGNLTCVPACIIAGFFADPLTRTCLYNCNQTAGYYGDPSDGRCYSRCPSGYGNPLNAQCVSKCPRVPKFFYGDNLTGLCVLSCPSETYGDPNNNLCVEAISCTAGLFGDDITGLCVAHCSELLGLYADPINGKCVPVCTWPLYADPTDQTCTDTCKSNFFKDNSTLSCVSTCSSLPDTYGDPNSGYCQYNCTNGWFGYALGSLRICLPMCPDNPPMLADLQSGMCVHKCANQTYQFSNNTFRGCVYVCPPQVFDASLQIDLFADNTTWKCVDVCPYGFYAFKHPNNSDIRQCVRMCPMVGSTYYYAEDTTRMCLTECPLLYEETYADKIDFKCTKVCSRGQFKDNSTATCVYRCPNGTYANNVTWNCSAWCDQGYFAENINNTCVKSCPKDFFGYQKVCIPQCPNNTMQYNDNSTWLCVQRCPSYPAYFADNSSVICVLSCPNGTYADQGTRQCVLPINCTEPTIADPATGRCVFQCPKEPMLFLTIQLNLCGSTCSNGTFAYNETNLCVDQCPEPYWGVNTTTDQFHCVQFCPQNYYMWVNITVRRCIPDCPEGLFRDNLTWSCVEDCPDYTYANESNNMCIPSCAPLYADDYSKTCVDICPDGTTTSNHSYKCQSYCDYGEYNLDKVCVSTCPTGLFADNLTRACLKSCPYDPLTFADPITKTCVIKCNQSEYAFLTNLTCNTTCPLGYYKELTLLLCLNKCLEGFYSDNDTQTCVPNCTLSSFPYADPTSQACLKKCPSDPDLYGYANNCLTQCPLGYFAENVTRTCVETCPNVSATYPNASWADDLTRRCLARCSALSYSFTNSTKNVCLNICPANFYASITEQACLTQCPPNTYAHNSSTTCVDQCPPGQWADLSLRVCMPNCSHNTSLYADNSSSSCVEVCPTYPDLFADTIAHRCVLTCPQGTFADDSSRKCLTMCLPPLFGDSYLLQCVSTCLMPQLSFADSVLRTCVGSCVNHTINGSQVIFYEDNSTRSCVQQCPQVPNKLYGDNSTNTCVQTCPVGSFGDNDTRVCLDKCVFQNPKFTWKDKTNNFCVTVCPYGYYADNFTGSCQLTCANGTFADPSSRRCVVNCPINPASYSTVIGGAGVCVYNCPNGTYSSQVSISCVTTCPTAPRVYYTYPPTNACVKECLYPFYADLALQACVDSCKVGFYGNKTLKSCQPCQVECVTCTGYLVCTSCIAGFYLYEITCVVQCPSYPVLYYANKQSGICNQSCSFPFFGQPSTGLCQLTCPALSYPNALTRVCTACPIGCQLCNAIGCSSCLVGYTFLPSAKACNQNCNATAKYYFNDTCWTKCPAGSYLSYDLIHCLACSRPCATCVGAAGNCTSCIGAYFYLGQCKDACPNNFYIDDKLNCVACSSNPQKCALPPLTYKISTFMANFRVKAYVVFSRAVTMTTEQFMSTVQIRLNNAPIKANQFTPTVYNSTTYLVTFAPDISLNQLSLSFYFPPGSISDQFGNTLTTVTVNQNVSVVVSVNAQVAKTSESIGSMGSYLSIAILILIVLLLLKSSYVGLVSLQALQLIHLHLYLYWNPIPYLEYTFLDTMRYFNFMFIPSFFSPIGVIDEHLETVLPEASFLKNSPLLLMFAIGLAVYLVVSIISNKNFVSNKSLRKLFKRIKKYRVKYGLLLDICWAVYPFAMFISLKQFKLSSIGNTTATINIALSGLTILILNAIVAYTIFLAYKYNKNHQKLPKRFVFLMLQPSNMLLDMPVRFLRKFLFVVALLLPSVQSQLILLLSVNISFFIMVACYRPSKVPLTHYLSLLLQFLIILLEGLCFAYDKMVNKSITNQTGFAYALISVQVAAMLIVLVWVGYRLWLNIKGSDVWIKIYAKLTENTDPEYLKEQQRKRDLEFDFEGLDARSQDERTDHALQKVTGKQPSQIGEKFNIFDRDREEGSFNLEKPFKVNQSVKRPASMESSEKMAINSRSSESKGFFQANRTAKGRRRNHLQIRNNELDNSVQEVMIISEENQSMAEIAPKKEEKEKGKGVLWEDIELDDDEY